MNVVVRGISFEIDDSDVDLFRSYKWTVVEPSPGYVYLGYRTSWADGHKAILFHREALKAGKGYFVDHIDGSTKNNKRENLRLCTHAENMRNRKVNKNSRTGVKGVSQRGNKFRAVITANGARKILGTFDTLEIAHQAYCLAAKSLHGEFARFN